MARRFCLCALNAVTVDGVNGWRPAVADYPIRGFAIVADQQTDPALQRPWVLALVAADATTLAQMDADAAINVLPISPADLSTIWNTLPSNTRTTWRQRIETRTGVIVAQDDSRTLGQILRAIGRVLHPDFEVDRLGASEG